MLSDHDVATFERAFARLVSTFRLKLPALELAELSRTYYQVLEAHPIETVVAASKRCLEEARTFPKPADWLAQVERLQRRLPATPDRRTMSVAEADALAYAAALGFEGQPCLCSECVRAGVDDRPLRFVPNERDDGAVEQALNPRTNTLETPGHWLHGEDLARWYAARDGFFALGRRTPRAQRLVHAVATILREREPGEEG